MKNIILPILLLLFVGSSCNSHYVQNNNTSASKTKLSKKQIVDENGVCWEDCLMPSVYEDEVTAYNVFTGNAETENVDLEEMEIEITPPNSKWVKKKADRNCLSADPNDCLVWCLVEVPAEVEKFTLLKDTSQSDNFEVKEITKKKLIKKGGYVEKQKVVCNDKISENLVMQVQNLLEAKNYDTGIPTKTVNALFKSGLTKFQREHDLPVGQLNFQTLEKLGIDF